jgi:hypothetical protein
VNCLSDTGFVLLGRDRECHELNRKSEGEENPNDANAMAESVLHIL